MIEKVKQENVLSKGPVQHANYWKQSVNYFIWQNNTRR